MWYGFRILKVWQNLKCLNQILSSSINFCISEEWFKRMKGMESGKKYIKLNKSRKNPGTIEKTTKEGLFVSAP